MMFPGLGELCSAIASGFGFFKAISFLPWRRKSDPKEDYRFLKEFLQDLESNKDMPLYQREMGYRALVRGAKVEPELVQCALRVRTYRDALADCALGHDFLEARRTGVDMQLEFRPQYAAQASRRRFRLRCFIQYGVFYLLATSPALLAVLSSGRDPRYLWLLLFTVPSFGPLSYFGLRKGPRLSAAERLLKHDREQRERVALPAIANEEAAAQA